VSGFMRLRIWQSDTVVTRSGELLPRSIAECDPEDPIESVEQTDEWWGEYTAPGYMDKTEPCGPYGDPIEAVCQTLFMYGDRGFEGAESGDDLEALEFLVNELGVDKDRAREMLQY
jgi:hypothetical protein